MTAPIVQTEADSPGPAPWMDGLSADPAAATATGTIAEAGPDVALVRLEDGRTGRLPVSEFFPHRRFEVGSRFVFAVIDDAPRPLLSVVAPELLPLLLDGVVPELRSGSVRVMAVARQVGVRSKVAVAATVPDVDPVGALLGRAAGRLRLVSRQLGGERLDIVSFHPELGRFVVNALAVRPLAVDTSVPGRVAVTVPAHQRAAALGGGNLNVALTARLTGCRVQVDSA